MKTIRTLIFAGAAALFGTGIAAPATAGDAVMISKNPSECEVASALGVNKAGCPPLAQIGAPAKKVGTRGLAIGNIDQMPEPPPPITPPTIETGTTGTIAVGSMATTPRSESRPPVRHEYTAAFQINFEFASAQLTDDARHVLDLVGTAMTAPDAAQARFRIVGHTDMVGSNDTNQKLSEERANAVKNYLINQHGITPSRLQAQGRGARDLLNRGDPRSSENRRVEITNLGG